MKKPNVLFISSWYPSEEHKTLGNFVQRHAEAIAKYANISVLVVVPSNIYKEKYTLKKEVINGIDTTIVYQRKSELPLVNKVLNLTSYLKAFRVGYKSINQNFNLVHCNVCFKSGLFAMELKQTKKLPYVLTEHWTIFLPYRDEYKTSTFAFKRYVKRIYYQAAMVCPVSRDLESALIKNNLIKSPVEVIPNVVNTDLFVPGSESDSETVNFLHISTLDDNQKNITGIFKTFKKLIATNSAVKLTIITDGNLDKGKALANQIGIDHGNLEFHPTQTPKNVVSFFQNADCFVLFSNYESFSIVLAESWACGVPTIHSNCGGLTTIDDDKLGIQVEPKNENQLLKAMQQIIDNKGTYDKEYARNYSISRFSNDVVGKQYIEVYNKVLN